MQAVQTSKQMTYQLVFSRHTFVKMFLSLALWGFLSQLGVSAFFGFIIAANTNAEDFPALRKCKQNLHSRSQMSQNEPNWQLCLFDKDDQVLSDQK